MMLAIIYPIAFFQHRFFFGEVSSQFYLAPSIAGTIIGILLARIQIVRRQLTAKSQQFLSLVDQANIFTYVIHGRDELKYVSPSCLDITGYSQAEFYQNPKLIFAMVNHKYTNYLGQSKERNQRAVCDLSITHKNGEQVWLNHIEEPVYNKAGEVIGFSSTNLDITQRKKFEDENKRLAYTDRLTGLGNRNALKKELNFFTKPSGSSSFALFFIDLIRFKNINDSLGHDFGDKLLKEVSKRLSGQSTNDAQVFRFGGDEFILINKAIRQRQEAYQHATKLVELIEQPFQILNTNVNISASIGFVLYPLDGKSGSELIKNADIAMYKTKALLGQNIRSYQPLDSKESDDKLDIEARIRDGIDNSEFTVFYQPKVDVATGKIVGVEALIRWFHEAYGMISPAQFLPVAEETGLIVELGELVFEQMLDDLVKLKRVLHCSYNVSARQFAQADFLKWIDSAVRRKDIDPAMIEFEITEQVFLGDLDNAQSLIKELQSFGFKVALDDFGTGYSSFSYLKELSVDTLKIDKSFINDIQTNSKQIAIVSALVSMCSELDIECVVEGVELAEQVELLVKHKVSTVQGYYYYKPMPFDELVKLVDRFQK
jgi:diguanylate cyclase (GGDEF)-like protein/PAS domain S-box-containing protein